MKKLKITVAGKVYEVTVEVLEDDGHEVRHPVRQSAPMPAHEAAILPHTAPGLEVPKEAGNVTCPMAGRVVAVSVQVGQTVKEGEQLMVLEAMKMNNYIYAPHDGKISAVFVRVGDAVEEGQLLVTLS